MGSKRITVKKFIERINDVLGVESSTFAERLAEALARLTEEGFEITLEQAQYIADELGIADEVDLEEFRRGLEVEVEEHSELGVEVGDIGLDLLEVGKIAYAHLKEDPHYYSKLATVIQEQEEKPKEKEGEEGEGEEEQQDNEKQKEETKPKKETKKKEEGAEASEPEPEIEEQEEVKEEIQQTELVVPESVAAAFANIPGPKRYDPINQRVYFMREGVVYSAPADNPDEVEEVVNEKLIKLLGFEEE